ncbi:MAG: DNA-protecting protein DprA [Gemmatimonadaceae bacterium]|nr:DNA-protecting protein DprA [Gemmatimonadaceae bacterium]
MRLALGDADYPEPLRALPDPPPLLWLRGDRALLDRPCVAIVGTRRATAYAERVTRQLASALARAGACVVSGMARGVDACAHRGALDVGGATCAVLGTGIDVVYPKAHAALQREIAAHGLLVSELAPANAAHGGSFPRRNRIIAALAQVTIVVEAGEKSGALITAEHAQILDRVVAAVPGPIDVPQARGSNLLLRDGAVIITSTSDVLTLCGLTPIARRADVPEGSTERALWDALGDGTTTLDALCTRTGLPAQEGMAALGLLEMRGLVECGAGGELRRL